jgi:hypothetical protein
MGRVVHYKEKQCVDCGLTFQPFSGFSTRCKDCRERHNREHIRQYRRRWYQEHHSTIRQYHKEYRKGWYKNHKEDILTYQRLHRENINELRRRRRKKFKEVWGYAGGKNNYELFIRSEEEGMHILTKKGFTNIERLTAYYKGFPFDLSAEKDGEVKLIDVTMNLHHKVDKKVKLLHALRIEGFILFLSPRFNRFALVPIRNERYISLEGRLKEIEKAE